MTPRRSDRAVLSCLLLCSGAAAAGTVKLDKEPVVLGRTESVRMEFTIDEAPGTEDRPLQLKANVGSFGDVSRLGAGHYAAIYIPPATRFPQVALIGVWRETGPEAPIDFFRVPLSGVTRVPVKAKPGSELKVAVGLEVSEAVVAGVKGEAVIPLVVAPGVTTAELTVKDPSGLVTQKKLAIDVPPYNRLTAALVPHALRADGSAWVRLEVFYDLGGADVAPSRIKVVPSVGAASLMRADQGRYVYRYVPAAGLKQAEVRFAISVQGDAASSAQAVLSLSVPAVTRLVVRPPAALLAPDGTSTATVQLLALDGAGLGVAGQTVQLTANGEPLAVADRGAGLYEATFRAPSRYPPDGQVVLLAALGGSAITSNASFKLRAPAVPASISATVHPNPAPADGATVVEVLLEVKDVSGAPLSGAALELAAEQGRVGPVSEQSPGRYRGTWVSAEGAVGSASLRVRDTTGAFEQAVEVRLRERARFELGVRGGFSHSLGDQVSPRAGLELWRGLALGPATLGVGLTLSYLYAAQAVTDASGATVSQSVAHVFPVALRLGYEVVYAGRFNFVVGLGGVLAYARFSTSLTGVVANGFGGGGQGFVAAGLRLGPGRVVLEAGYGYVPVQLPSFAVQAGGLFVDLGYRFLL